MHEWMVLLRTAYRFTSRAGIPPEDWTFGGGTALAYHYGHRESRDVDIFVWNVSHLTLLTPRLNGEIEAEVDSYDETAHSLKLRVGQGEIDFIAAPSLTAVPHEWREVADLRMQVETPAEIAVKKLFYRALDLKVRDVVDIAAVLLRDRAALLANLGVFRSRLPALRKRLADLARFYDREVGLLAVTDQQLARCALDVVRAFLAEAAPGE